MQLHLHIKLQGYKYRILGNKITPRAVNTLRALCAAIVQGEMCCRLLPARVSEIIGVCHLKAYVFDDDVLISGANMSTTYFTKRQDRYYLFKKAAKLAGFVRSLVEVLLPTWH